MNDINEKIYCINFQKIDEGEKIKNMKYNVFGNKKLQQFGFFQNETGLEVFYTNSKDRLQKLIKTMIENSSWKYTKPEYLEKSGSLNIMIHVFEGLRIKQNGIIDFISNNIFEQFKENAL